MLNNTDLHDQGYLKKLNLKKEDSLYKYFTYHKSLAKKMNFNFKY